GYREAGCRQHRSGWSLCTTAVGAQEAGPRRPLRLLVFAAQPEIRHHQEGAANGVEDDLPRFWNRAHHKSFAGHQEGAISRQPLTRETLRRLIATAGRLLYASRCRQQSANIGTQIFPVGAGIFVRTGGRKLIVAILPVVVTCQYDG